MKHLFKKFIASRIRPEDKTAVSSMLLDVKNHAEVRSIMDLELKNAMSEVKGLEIPNARV